jgi:acetyl esterase/lipase
MRQGMNSRGRPPTADVPFEKRSIPGTGGRPDVTLYVINARRAGSRPAILHTHGGGFVMGTAAGSIADLQAICKALDCLAVTVDYRLAPETIWAGSVEDNYAGLKWLHDEAGELGADPRRIAVMGESAGGGHAALLAITARDRGEVPVAFQCLTYPMLDDRTGSARAVPGHVGKLMWTAASNRFGWQSFLGGPAGARSAPRGAVPARVEVLAGLPPAFIGVGSIDLFCDEDIDYARRLDDAGVPAELIVVPGAFHGFDGFAAPISQWFSNAKLDALRRGLGIAAA